MKKMSRRKSENLKRYSTVGRLSVNTTGSLDDDSNVINANDPVFYNRMGQFKRSLDATHTESSVLDSESLVSPGTPSKNWYKNLDKFNKTLMHSPKNAKHNPHNLTTGKVLEANFEQIGREMSASNKSPSEEESLNKTKNSELTDLDKSTTLNYSEELLKKRKPRTLQKLGNTESKSTNVFKKFFDDDSLSDASKEKQQASLDISSRRRSNFPNERLLSLNKSKNSETTDSDKSVELDYSEMLLKKRKPRTLQKFGNIPSKSTENVFKKFFDDDDSLNDESNEKQDSMEISSRRRNISNENANASQNEANASLVSRKRKLEGLETSHNSSLTKKRGSAGSENSVNLSHSPTMSLKYVEKSETFTQPQKEKLKELLNESISKARFSKNEFSASEKVIISPPIERNDSKSSSSATTETVDEVSNLQSKSISRHSQKSTHVQNKSAGNLSFVINQQSAVDNSESDVDVESRNEQIFKGTKDALLHPHVLNASQSEELVNNRHSISDSNIKLKSPRKSSRLNKSVEFERQLISSHLNNFIEEPQFESTRKLDSNQSRPSLKKREAIRKSTLSGIVDEASEIQPRAAAVAAAAVQSEVKTVSLNKSKTLNQDVSDEKEASNYNIQVTNPAFNSSPKSTNSKNSKTVGVENMSRDGHSEKSFTISLSEGSSRTSVSSREESVAEFPHNNSQRLSSSSFKRSPLKSSASETDNKSIKETAEYRSQKPKIISSQIVNSNDIDLSKLKGNYKQSPTEESEVNLERSGINFKTFSKRPRVSTIEEEFSLMHGVEDEQVPSTSDGRTGNSRNRTSPLLNASNALKSSTQLNNSSLKSLRKTLESEEDSEYSDSPLITYYQDDDFNKEENRSQSPPTSPPPLVAERSKKQNKENVPGLSEGQLVQKNIKDFAESRTIGSLATSGKSVAKLNTDNSELMSVSEVMNDKKKWDEFYKRLSENKRQTQKKLDAAAAARLKVEAQKKPVKPIKEKKPPKPVHSAYLVNGKLYKQPKLPRPMSWATNRLYDYISKKIEPKYDIRTRIESGNIVNHLAAVVKKTLKAKLFKNYAEHLASLKKHMAEAGLIVTEKDFIDFCTEYLPMGFRMKATPMLLPGNKMNMPFDWSKLNTPIEYS